MNFGFNQNQPHNYQQQPQPQQFQNFNGPSKQLDHQPAPHQRPQDQYQPYQQDRNLIATRSSFGSSTQFSSTATTAKSPTLSTNSTTSSSHYSNTYSSRQDSRSTMDSSRRSDEFGSRQYNSQGNSQFGAQNQNGHMHMNSQLPSQTQRSQQSFSQNPQLDSIDNLDPLPQPHPQFQNLNSQSTEGEFLDSNSSGNSAQNAQNVNSNNPNVPPRQAAPQYVHPHLAQHHQKLDEQNRRQEQFRLEAQRQLSSQNSSSNMSQNGNVPYGPSSLKVTSNEAVQTISDPNSLLNTDIPIFLEDGQYKVVLPMLRNSAKKRPRRASVSLSAGATCAEIANFRQSQLNKRAQMAQRSTLNSPAFGATGNGTNLSQQNLAHLSQLGQQIDPKTKAAMRKSVQAYQKNQENGINLFGNDQNGQNNDQNGPNNTAPRNRKSLNINVGANTIRTIQSNHSGMGGDGDEDMDEFDDVFDGELMNPIHEPLTPFNQNTNIFKANDAFKTPAPTSSYGANPNKTPFRPTNRANNGRMTTASFPNKSTAFASALATPAPSNTLRPVLQQQFRGQHKLAKKQSKMLLENGPNDQTDDAFSNPGDFSSHSLQDSLNNSLNSTTNSGIDGFGLGGSLGGGRRGVRIGAVSAGSANFGHLTSSSATSLNNFSNQSDTIIGKGDGMFGEVDNDHIYPNDNFNTSLSEIDNFDEFSPSGDLFQANPRNNATGVGLQGQQAPPQEKKLKLKKKPQVYEIQMQQNSDNALFGAFDNNQNVFGIEAVAQFPLFLPKVDKKKSGDENQPYRFRSPTKEVGLDSDDDLDYDDDGNEIGGFGFGGDDDLDQFGAKKSTFFGGIKRRNRAENHRDDDLVWVSLVPQQQNTLAPDGTVFTPTAEYQTLDNNSNGSGNLDTTFNQNSQNNLSQDNIPAFDPLSNFDAVGNKVDSNLGRFQSINENSSRQRHTPTQPPPCIRRTIKTRLSFGHTVVNQMNDNGSNGTGNGNNNANIVYIEQPAKPIHQMALTSGHGQTVVLGTIVHNADISDSDDNGTLNFDDDEETNQNASEMVQNFAQMNLPPTGPIPNNRSSPAHKLGGGTGSQGGNDNLLEGFEDLLGPNSGSIGSLTQKIKTSLDSNPAIVHHSPGRFGTPNFNRATGPSSRFGGQNVQNGQNLPNNGSNTQSRSQNINDLNDPTLMMSTPIRPNNNNRMGNDTPNANLQTPRMDTTMPLSANPSVGRFGRPLNRFGGAPASNTQLQPPQTSTTGPVEYDEFGFRKIG